eukprot:Gb_35158 [translate_table: standard]
MGQVWGQLQNIFKSKELREQEVRKITDRIFDRFTAGTEKTTLTYEELYKAMTLAIEEFNKYLPGPLYNLPSQEEIEQMLQKSDANQDKEIDKDEFYKFVEELASTLLSKFPKDVLIVTAVVPAAAMVAKKASEKVPVIGPLMGRIPYTVFMATVTSAAVLIQSLFKKR